MKTVFSIMPIILLVPILGLAQGHHVKNNDFYIELGFKDAHYEQNMGSVAYADELDFWDDQRAFELMLKQKNPKAHQSYLNGKHVAYGQHQKQCDGNCGHSDFYFRQASYYAVNGVFDLEDDFVISINKTYR